MITKCCFRPVMFTCQTLMSLDFQFSPNSENLCICLISDSLFNVQFPTCQFYLSISDVNTPSEFFEGSANLVTETFAESAANW